MTGIRGKNDDDRKDELGSNEKDQKKTAENKIQPLGAVVGTYYD